MPAPQFATCLAGRIADGHPDGSPAGALQGAWGGDQLRLVINAQGGRIATACTEGGFGWGCGTLNDKRKHITQLEAVEMPIRLSVKPGRSVDLGFGHDEAVGAAWLRAA